MLGNIYNLQSRRERESVHSPNHCPLKQSFDIRMGYEMRKYENLKITKQHSHTHSQNIEWMDILGTNICYLVWYIYILHKVVGSKQVKNNNDEIEREREKMGAFVWTFNSN